jgi:V/A-type H+-transporting ATPase subunit D
VSGASRSALGDLRQRLRLYREFLPALDGKRRQLLARRREERARLSEAEASLQALLAGIGERLPMLANGDVALDGLVRRVDALRENENVCGLAMPRLAGVHVEVAPQALLGLPQWVDALVQSLRQAIELASTCAVLRERIGCLDAAIVAATRRVNLFEVVLIPAATSAARQLQVRIGDAERSGTVRARLAKARAGRRAEPRTVPPGAAAVAAR